MTKQEKKDEMKNKISMALIAENDQDYNAIEQAEQFLKEIEKNVL